MVRIDERHDVDLPLAVLLIEDEKPVSGDALRFPPSMKGKEAGITASARVSVAKT
jgi:hypothetical protein